MTKVTRDVITDLWPVYASGEASADTRVLVEEFLRQDPEFARQAQEARSDAMLKPIPVALVPEKEKAALALTQRLIRRRMRLLASAIFFTLLPGSFSFGTSRGFAWILWRDFPLGAGLSLLVAVGLWIGFLLNSRRLRVSGF